MSKFDFLKKKNDVNQEEVNWEEEKLKWISELSHLFQSIENWLAEPSEEGLVTLIQTEHSISEEHLGSYKAPGMQVLANLTQLEFIPIGRLIIGAQGRVDIFCEKGDLMLLKTKNPNEWILREKRRDGFIKTWSEEVFIETMKWAVE